MVVAPSVSARSKRASRRRLAKLLFPGGDGAALRRPPVLACELILGSCLPILSSAPVLLFGTGGEYGRGVSRPRAGPATTQHHLSPADDGADADLSCVRRGAGPSARRRRGARWAACSIRRSGRRESTNSRDRHQPLAGIARGALGARCAGGPPRQRGSRRRSPENRDPAVSQ